jgi:crossover junction endodeoxyribonuclease RuvC
VPKTKPSIILGIDPGTIIMGYGLIKVEQNKITLLDMGVLQPGKIKDTYKKLELIYTSVTGLIIKYQPDTFAIEAPFFGKNVQSMLKLGRAQGVAIAAAMRHGIEVTEYSPKKVKQSVTGNGNAGKEQVMKMLQQILQFKEDPKHFDATDALAVAVCHHFQNSSPLATTNKKISAQGSRGKGWEAFVAQNPSRVKKV